MPRRNHPKRRKPRHLAGSFKPSGAKRPRSYHHGPLRDEHYAEAERLMREAEDRWGEAAA
jgi:hypothetical protein